MKKLNNFIKSRAFIITLSLTFIALIIAGVTYAWFTWTSTDNTNITMQIGEYTTVTYTGGNAINITDLAPVYNYTDGESTTFTLTNSNIDVTKEFKYSVYLDITSISNELKTTQFKYVLLDGSSNIIDQGDFSTASNGSTLTITENKSLPNGNSSYTFLLYIDGNETNNSNMMNKSLTGSLRVTVVRGSVFPVNAAEYITNLYTSANKSPATVNNITYNLAPSVNLMNDRHASMDTDINDGDIRYYGDNPNNYVWLGDTYIEDITFPGNRNIGLQDISRTVGDKKLWRVIGVFDGKLKLIQNDPISTIELSWDTSVNNVNEGWGINQWGPSGAYEGADLMRLLNPGYVEESVNNSLYWNKGTGTVYTGQSNATTPDVSFANTGLTENERSLIDNATWYTGAYDEISYVDAHYNAERGSMGKICTQGTIQCNDTVTRTNTWNGKIGLMSASDYGYAADLSQCNATLDNYGQNECKNTNWFKLNKNTWTMSPRATLFARVVFFVSEYNFKMSFGNAGINNIITRPVIYLNSNVVIMDGDGSDDTPYILSLNQ